MQTIYPKKLKTGDQVRIIAPSQSFSIISSDVRKIAKDRFEQLGLVVTFGEHIEEADELGSSSLESRLSDFHAAFRDLEVAAIFVVIGGFNCNQLLKYIDWDLVKNNPKILIGYSDTTALQNAIFAKTGLVTYSGPTYSSFGEREHFEYTLKYFKKCLMEEQEFLVEPSEKWSNDAWYLDQDNRNLLKNDGWLPINYGKAHGTIVGGNLCTLNLLQGTEYVPSLGGSILCIEDDYESKIVNFERDLQSLVHLPEFSGVRGIVIGRFETKSNVQNEQLVSIIKTKKELENLPVIANVDFGHTEPKITFPIGGEVEIGVSESHSSILITKH